MSEDRIVLHVDMDAFYASVEQRERPELAGRPVVVGADPQQGEGRGVVAAASYEARRYGVHSAQPISQAWRACPGGVYVRPRFELYESVGEEVMTLVEEAVDVLERVSIDEAYADVSHRCGGSFQAAERLSEAIRRRVMDETGLSCSVGVGPNKLVAKIASDEDKPDGLTVVEPDEVQAFLAKRPASAIAGVGTKTADLLSEHGIETVADLAATEPGQLQTLLGSWGPRIGAMARGVDERPVDPSWERKSVGAEQTFAEDLAPQAARQRLASVAGQTSRRLGELDRQARTVVVKVRLEPFETFTRQQTLSAPTDDPHVIEAVATQLFDELAPERRVRLVGVRAADLTRGDAKQATLDHWPADVLGEEDRQPRWEQEGYWRFS